MGRIVADATPIVYLAKTGKLQLLRQLYEDVIVPPWIREELLTGKHPEIPVIEEAFDAGWLEERALKQKAKNFQHAQAPKVSPMAKTPKSASNWMVVILASAPATSCRTRCTSSGPGRSRSLTRLPCPYGCSARRRPGAKLQWGGNFRSSRFLEANSSRSETQDP